MPVLESWVKRFDCVLVNSKRLDMQYYTCDERFWVVPFFKRSVLRQEAGGKHSIEFGQLSFSPCTCWSV